MLARFLVGIEAAFDADHRIEAQQLDRGRRAIEIDRAATNRVDHARRQTSDIDLEAEPERLAWGDTRDRFVQTELTAEELLAAERVVAKHVAACLEQVRVVAHDRLVPARGLGRDACFARQDVAAPVVVPQPITITRAIHGGLIIVASGSKQRKAAGCVPGSDLAISHGGRAPERASSTSAATRAPA